MENLWLANTLPETLVNVKSWGSLQFTGEISVYNARKADGSIGLDVPIFICSFSFRVLFALFSRSDDNNLPGNC